MLLAHAQQLAAKSLAKAAELDVHVAVVILDVGGRLVLTHRMDRAAYITPDVGRMKAEVAVNLQTPTHVLAGVAKHTPTLRDAVVVGFANARLLPGGFPIVVEGVVVGGLGISGANAQNDTLIGEAAFAEPPANDLAKRAVQTEIE